MEYTSYEKVGVIVVKFKNQCELIDFAVNLKANYQKLLDIEEKEGFKAKFLFDTLRDGWSRGLYGCVVMVSNGGCNMVHSSYAHLYFYDGDIDEWVDCLLK